MHENLVIIPRKKTMKNTVLCTLWFVLACLMLLAATFLNPVIFFIPAIGFAVLWYFQTFRSNVEFEYTYYDGDLRLAKIKNKNRRKKILNTTMDDVITIAPLGDRSVYKYENDNQISCKKLTSGDPDAKVYNLIYKGEKGIGRIEFEPDEEMLTAMLMKYPRTVVK